MRSFIYRLRSGARAAGLAALVLVFAAQPAAAYLGDTYDPTPGERDWPLQAILTYSWLPNHEPPNWMAPLIRAEIAHLNDGTQGARLPVFRFTTDPRAAHLKIGYGIPQGADAPACAEVGSIVCIQRLPETPLRDKILLFAKDVRDGSPHDWQKYCQYRGTPPQGYREGCFDVSHVTLRAMGFVYGLHRWDVDQYGKFGPGARITVMSAWALRRGVPGFQRIDFGRCDVARLQLLYDVFSPRSLYSTCLDRQATQLELGADDQSVGYRDPVHFRAKLKLDVTEPEVFVGNLVSGRRVVLQRSTDGFATFDSRVMEPQPGGLYTLTVRPAESASYRAVFQPIGEGLAGDTSDVVEVFVAPPPPA